MPAARRRPALRDVFVCLAVLLAARAALVLTLADCFFTGEELAHGAISKALLDGLDLRLCDVNYVYYEGGGLLAGFVGAFFFLIVGPSLLALKLTALVFDVLNLCAGMFLAARFEARRAPLFFGLTYVLAPIACQQMALIDVGNHHLAISFFFLVLLFALRVLDRPAGERPRAFDCVALGLSAGFGTWCDLMLAPLVAFVFVLLLTARGRVLELRSWGLLVLSFAVGMAPFWYMLASVGLRVLDVHGMDLRTPFGATPTRGSKADLVARAWSALGPRGRLQCLLLGLIPFLALLGRRRRDGSPWSPAARQAWSTCVLFMAFFLALTVMSRFCPVDLYHYQDMMRLLPHAALLALLVAGALARLVEGPSAALRAAGWVLLGAELALGVWGTVELARAGKAAGPAEALDVLMTTKGYDYGEYVPNLVAKFGPEDPLRGRAALGFEEPDPGLLYPAVAASLYPRCEVQALRVVRGELAELDPERVDAFLAGMGRGLVTPRKGDFCAVLRALEGERMPEALRAVLIEAVGRYGSGRHLRARTFEQDLEAAQSCQAPPGFFRGYGYRIYFGHRIDRGGAEAFLARWPPEVEEPLREGYEACRRLSSVGN
jgi:hypothetical protein